MDLKNTFNTALLVIDIQNDYFEGGANALDGSLSASLVARKVIDNFREARLPVIHIQHLSVRPGSTFFIPGTKGAEIHENVRPEEGEKCVLKNFPNAFRDTGLNEYLSSLKIKNLVICGMMTHMCVDATTRAAKDLGYACTLVANACATRHLDFNGHRVNAADVHHAFLAALNYYYATVVIEL